MRIADLARVIDLERFEVVQTYTLGEPLTGAARSRDGRYFAAASMKRVVIWDTRTNERIVDGCGSFAGERKAIGFAGLRRSRCSR